MLLFGLAGVVAGIVTVIAGGAQFITFPMLNLVGGLPARIANGTSSMAVWPSPLLSSFMMHKDIKLKHSFVLKLVCISLVGSIGGALLVKSLSEFQFLHMVPFLLLIAAVALTWGEAIRKALHKRKLTLNSYRFLFLQLLFSVYAGIYGGGVAIMMLSSYGFFVFKSLKAPQALKNMLVAIMGLAAAATFLLSGLVSWKFALPLMIGDVIGGRIGTHLLRSLNPHIIKKVVIVFAWLTTVYYFVK